MTKKTFKTKGMTCDGCEKIITKQINKLPGITSFKIDYATETATIEYDPSLTSFSEIKEIIENKGYICEDIKENQQGYVINKSSIYWFFAGLGLLLVVYFAWTLYGTIELPTISQNMGYGLLFVVGLLTGFHCIGMCGGFVMSYTTKGVKEGKKPSSLHASYGIGKTLSYTLMGAFFGLLGSIVAFTPMMRGVAGILAGLFLILFGLKMLNIFPFLRKLNFKTPKFLLKFVKTEKRKHSNPFMIGLLNGLMIACGPLQAIYVMAAGTGSMIEGAKLLFVFGLGTLPVMLGFGYITSLIGKRATYKILKLSGVIVIILGIVMLNRGLALTGTGIDYNTLNSQLFSFSEKSSPDNQNFPSMKDGYQEIFMEVNRYGWSPDKFVLKKGVPVKWIIDGKEINGCNNAIQVPKMGLNFDIKKGQQIIEFTPTEMGTISWSCWMGMIPGVFVVEDDLSVGSFALNNIELPPASICGGEGGCGCGGS